MSAYNNVSNRLLVDIDNERPRDFDFVGLTKSGVDYVNDMYEIYSKEWHKLIDFFSFEHYNSVIEYAKDLFIAYGCNKINLFRDGWYDVHSLCDITIEIEKDWIEQYYDKSKKSEYDDNNHLNS